MTDEDSPVVMVTGASQGMGAEVVKWLARAGCRIALTARSVDPLEALASMLKTKAGALLPLAFDVSDAAQCRLAVNKTLERFGRLDALVNNAGTLEPMAPIAQADIDQWQYGIGVNLLGPFYLTRYALDALRHVRGRVVNVSSGAARNPIAGWSAYCAAKAGLTHFTRVLAVEEPRVTCVALRPGIVDTGMQALIRSQGASAMDAEKVAYFHRLKSENRLEPPAVPARALAWLALYAPQSWSGEFMEYDDPRISVPAMEKFGNPEQGNP